MTVTTFDPAADLIIVQAYVWGARGQERELRLVVDTGAGPTVIASEILEALGCSAREHGEVSKIRPRLSRQCRDNWRLGTTAASCRSAPTRSSEKAH